MTECNQSEIFETLRDASWSRAPVNSEGLVFCACANGRNFSLRINDFPDEVMFTVFLDGNMLFDFNDWPDALGIAPWKTIKPCDTE